MTSLSTLVNQTKRTALGRQRESHNVLASAVTSTSQASLSFTYELGPIRPGAVVELGYELCYVWSVNQQAKSAEVQRGYQDTTATTYASGQLATVNPRISASQVVEEINYELADLSSPMNRVFQVDTVDITYNPAAVGYDIDASDIIEILEVRYNSEAYENDWRMVRRWQLSRDMPTSDFASGAALFLNEFIPSGNQVRVRYSKAFDPISSSATGSVETQSGIPSSAVDILYLGAALRILSLREIPRSEMGAQPDPRRAEEVPPGAVLTSIRDLRALRDRRVKEESARLMRQYPHRLKNWPQ